MSIIHTSGEYHEHDHKREVEHSRGHDHEVRSASEGGTRDLLIALSITVLMMLVEAVGGVLANSLALLSDAGHMLTDNLALLLSFFAMKFATMPATEKKTFGFYRLEILAALLNGIILVIISIYIVYHAYLRLVHPQPVQGGLMLIVALIGLTANIIGVFFLFKHSHSSLNIRGAYFHILGDALSSVGVVIGGGIIICTGWYLIDPILSMLISLVIIYGSWSLVTESVNILLEAVPSHINIEAVAAEMSKIAGVREVYHIHIWTITSGVYAMSAHVLVDDQLVSGSRNISDEIKDLLSRKFSILHSTIQLECERCDTAAVCSLPSTNRRNH